MSDEKTTRQLILMHIAEEDIPANEINLWSSLRNNLVKSKPFTKQGDSKMSTNEVKQKRMRVAISFSLLVLVSLVFLIFTPVGMTLAQQVRGFFIPAQQTSYPAATYDTAAWEKTEDPQSMLSPTETSASAQFCPQTSQNELDAKYICDLTYIQKEIGIWVKVLPYNHASLEYRKFDIFEIPSSTNRVLRIEYGPAPDGAIGLTQGQGDFPQTLSVDGKGPAYGEVPQEAIEAVTVNGLPGEYVAGGFVQLPGSDQYTWKSDMAMARLRWREGETWFEISRPGTPEDLNDVIGSKENIIQLAEALVQITEISQN